MLRQLLERIDGKPYGAYRELLGRWSLGALDVVIDHVQGDPFAAPTRARLIVPTTLVADGGARLATEDWLTRRFGARLPGRTRGSGKSGRLFCYRPGPEVVERSTVRLLPGAIEVRFSLGLPARGRRILGREAFAMLSEDLPLAAEALEPDPSLQAHVDAVVAQRMLRDQLRERGLVAFVANGSVLPRATGVDQGPLPDAVPFVAPHSLEVTLAVPGGEVRGMGIGEGTTLIVGGGFHGKSTLLQAIQRGHMDHVPGDGRERVVADPDVVKVRAEDGRSVTDTDISPFLGDLPGGRSTRPFSTADASGSTSQAAAIVEAVESGARVLLLDEDTSATNLLVRDARMRRLIPREREPITPFVERVRQLRDDWGVSTIMVVGGVGDYLAVADRVVAMENYAPRDVTSRARELAPDAPAPPGPLLAVGERVPLRDGLRPDKIRAHDERRIRYGEGEIELSAVEHILDPAHATSVGQALRLLYEQLVDGRRNVRQILDALDAILDDEGVEALSPWRSPPGNLVRPRRHEAAAALSRLRTLTTARGGR